MSELDCKICFDAYDEKEHCPRILNCGHTFCSPCITSLMQSTKSCPSCRMEMPEQVCDDFPVNYVLLEIKESRDNLPNSWVDISELYLERLLNLQETHSSFKTMLQLEKNINDNHISLIDEIEEKLQTLIEENVPFNKKSINELEKIEDLFTQVRSARARSGSLLQEEVSMYSSDFNSPEEFLTALYKGLWNGERFAAVLKIKSATKYAKLSARDNFLLIHAFEEDKENRQVKTVCYKDLISKLTQNQSLEISSKVGSSQEMRASLYGFLDLTFDAGGLCQRVFIEMLPSAVFLGPQFLKYCTGEKGKSYKGSYYEQNLESQVNLKNYIINGDRFVILNCHGCEKEVDSIFRLFLINKDTAFTCSSGQLYLVLAENESFEILRPLLIDCYDRPINQDLSNIVGKVVDTSGKFSIFRGASLKRVLDCGVAIKI